MFIYISSYGPLMDWSTKVLSKKIYIFLFAFLFIFNTSLFSQENIQINDQTFYKSPGSELWIKDGEENKILYSYRQGRMIPTISQTSVKRDKNDYVPPFIFVSTIINFKNEHGSFGENTSALGSKIIPVRYLDKTYFYPVQDINAIIRRNYKDGKLETEEIRLLSQNGYQFNPYNKRRPPIPVYLQVEALKMFYNNYKSFGEVGSSMGSLDIIIIMDGEEISVSVQKLNRSIRSAYKKALLSEVDIKRLKDLGYNFKPYAEKEDRIPVSYYVTALLSFYKINKNFGGRDHPNNKMQIPIDFRSKTYYKTINEINHAVTDAFRSNSNGLKQEDIKKLSELGYKFIVNYNSIDSFKKLLESISYIEGISEDDKKDFIKAVYKYVGVGIIKGKLDLSEEEYQKLYTNLSYSLLHNHYIKLDSYQLAFNNMNGLNEISELQKHKILSDCYLYYDVFIKQDKLDLTKKEKDKINLIISILYYARKTASYLDFLVDNELHKVLVQNQKKSEPFDIFARVEALCILYSEDLILNSIKEAFPEKNNTDLFKLLLDQIEFGKDLAIKLKELIIKNNVKGQTIYKLIELTKSKYPNIYYIQNIKYPGDNGLDYLLDIAQTEGLMSKKFLSLYANTDISKILYSIKETNMFDDLSDGRFYNYLILLDKERNLSKQAPQINFPYEKPAPSKAQAISMAQKYTELKGETDLYVLKMAIAQKINQMNGIFDFKTSIFLFGDRKVGGFYHYLSDNIQNEDDKYFLMLLTMLCFSKDNITLLFSDKQYISHLLLNNLKTYDFIYTTTGGAGSLKGFKGYYKNYPNIINKLTIPKTSPRIK
jgi:hypothetical protein